MPNNKESKPEKDQATRSMESNPCGLCRYKFPVCTGHAPSGGGGSKGGGSGSGGGGGELVIISASKAKNTSDIFYITSVEGKVKIVDVAGNALASKELESKILFAYLQTVFKPELEIKSDTQKLTYTMQIKSDLPEDEKKIMQEFLKSVIERCEKFMAKKGFRKGDYQANIDMKTGRLEIHIPDKFYYQRFVDKVAKNLNLLETKDKLEQAKYKQQKAEGGATEEKITTRLGKTPTRYSTRLERK